MPTRARAGASLDRMTEDADGLARLAGNRLAGYGIYGRLARAVTEEREKAASLEQRVALLEQQLDQVLALLADEAE